jgi:hypothetical protein
MAVEAADAGIKTASQNYASVARSVAELKIHNCVGRKPISLATVARGQRNGVVNSGRFV